MNVPQVSGCGPAAPNRNRHALARVPLQGKGFDSGGASASGVIDLTYRLVPERSQCASALGAAGGCTLRIRGTIAVAMMKQTMIIKNASP